MPRSHTRITTTLLAILLLAGACGSDGDDSTDDDRAGTTTTADGSTTTGASGTAPPETTASDPSSPADEIAAGSLTTAGDITTNWALTGSATALCFEADLSHPDQAISESIGDGVAACLEPDGGLDQLETGLSVDVGTVDGEKTIGFIWGRVAPEIVSLSIEHTDGTRTPVDILDGPTEVGVFAFVTEIATLPPVQELDAVSSADVETSVPIRAFLRDGPTYPTTTPAPSTTPPSYPVN